MMSLLEREDSIENNFVNIVGFLNFVVELLKAAQ